MTLNIERLSVDSIDTKPVSVEGWPVESLEDFADHDAATWNYWEAVQCEKCDRLIVGSGGYVACGQPMTEDDEPLLIDEDDDNFDDLNDHECDGSGLAEGPMMNYWYPIRFSADNEDAAKLIANLSLCVVEVNGETGLALTGGGMDFSWEICEAFIRLGHYPPIHFSDLPKESINLSDERKQVVIAMFHANDIAMSWAQSRKERLVGTYGIELKATLK